MYILGYDWRASAHGGLLHEDGSGYGQTDPRSQAVLGDQRNTPRRRRSPWG